MNYILLKKKMDKYFEAVTPEELISKFEALGYELTIEPYLMSENEDIAAAFESMPSGVMVWSNLPESISEETIYNLNSEYDKLKEDNEKLQAYSKDLIESNIDLSNVRNRLHEEKMKLREDNALLIEALENVLMELKCYDWSKETEPVYNKAKELLNNIKKNKQ